MDTMIQVKYRRYKKDEYVLPFETYYEAFAYFPTYKAALVLTSRWNTDSFVYEIVSVDKVPMCQTQIHDDCNHYSHLI